MTRKVKLTAIGNSTGVILPKELLERLRVSRGDELQVLETPNGIELTPFDAEFAEQMVQAQSGEVDTNVPNPKLALFRGTIGANFGFKGH
jgi:putative addiction module antidote